MICANIVPVITTASTNAATTIASCRLGLRHTIWLSGGVELSDGRKELGGGDGILESIRLTITVAVIDSRIT